MKKIRFILIALIAIFPFSQVFAISDLVGIYHTKKEFLPHQKGLLILRPTGEFVYRFRDDEKTLTRSGHYFQKEDTIQLAYLGFTPMQLSIQKDHTFATVDSNGAVFHDDEWVYEKLGK